MRFDGDTSGRASVTILAGAAAVGMLIYWLAFSTGASGSSDAGPAALVHRPPAQENARHVKPPEELPEEAHPLDLAAPAEQPAEVVQPESATPASSSSLPHVARADNPHRLYVPAEFFAERYAGASLAELGAAKAVIEAEFGRLSVVLPAQYLDSGRGETQIKDRPETDELVYPPGKETYGLLSTSRAKVLPNGQLQAETAMLPWDEYTSLYDTQDELFWLMHKIDKEIESGIVPSDE